jgi:hypothetical protein
MLSTVKLQLHSVHHVFMIFSKWLDFIISKMINRSLIWPKHYHVENCVFIFLFGAYAFKVRKDVHMTQRKKKRKKAILKLSWFFFKKYNFKWKYYARKFLAFSVKIVFVCLYLKLFANLYFLFCSQFEMSNMFCGLQNP